jgi:hypothetical protein
MRLLLLAVPDFWEKKRRRWLLVASSQALFRNDADLLARRLLKSSY